MGHARYGTWPYDWLIDWLDSTAWFNWLIDWLIGFDCLVDRSIDWLIDCYCCEIGELCCIDWKLFNFFLLLFDMSSFRFQGVHIVWHFETRSNGLFQITTSHTSWTLRTLMIRCVFWLSTRFRLDVFKPTRISTHPDHQTSTRPSFNQNIRVRRSWTGESHHGCSTGASGTASKNPNSVAHSRDVYLIQQIVKRNSKEFLSIKILFKKTKKN